VDNATARYVTGVLRAFVQRVPTPRSMDDDDLVQVGLVEAVKAERRWRPTGRGDQRGKTLRNWLVMRGQGAILDHVRSYGARYRDGRDRPQAVSLDALDAEGAESVLPSTPSAEDEVLGRWQERHVRSAIAQVRAHNPRLGFIAMWLYEECGSQRELARRLKVSATRASQLVQDTRATLRGLLR
jgi:RNA polymerase sigma factor (sigma-70 family)